jgi:hypothetical protein
MELEIDFPRWRYMACEETVNVCQRLVGPGVVCWKPVTHGTGCPYNPAWKHFRTARERMGVEDVTHEKM